jgi:predicted MPP superfamily phosphohydrolase
VFGVILVVCGTVMQGYVFWRASSVSFVNKTVPRRLFAWVGLLLWALFLLGNIGTTDWTGVLTGPLEFWSMTWLGMLFLTSVVLLAVDVTTGFGMWMKQAVHLLRAAALATGFVLSAIALVQGLRAPVVESYEVRIANLPVELDGTIVIALSDLHLGSLLGLSWLEARLKQVQAEGPDMVVFIGDVFEGHSGPDPTLLAALRGLSAPLGVWGVLGNHEYHTVGVDDSNIFEAAGIHLLRNAWVALRPGLVIAGVDDAAATGRSGVGVTPLNVTLAGRPPGTLVLLTHTPLPMEGIGGAGVDLMVAGHTHGGQIWPFGYLVKQRFPLFEGRYDLGESTAIVSRGVGTWGPRMRLWKPAEIVRITLRSDGKYQQQHQ